MSLNRLCLVINASYEPINVISARRALTLVFKGAAVVEEVSAYTIRTTKISIPVPSVVRLMKYRRMPRQNRSVSPQGNPAARRQPPPVLRRQAARGKPDAGPRGATLAARPLDMGEPGGLLLRLQQQEGRSHAAGSRHGAGETAPADQHPRQAQAAGGRCPDVGQVSLCLTRVYLRRIRAGFSITSTVSGTRLKQKAGEIVNERG